MSTLLHPNCPDDPCVDCTDCFIIESGCYVKWFCVASTVQVFGPNGGLRSTDPAGQIFRPSYGRWELWACNGIGCTPQLVATVEVENWQDEDCVIDETCCDIFNSNIDTHALSDLSFLSSACGAFANTYIFPARQETLLNCPEQSGAPTVCRSDFNIVYKPLGSGFCYDPNTSPPLLTTKQSVIDASCHTGTVGGVQFWYAMIELTLFATQWYSSETGIDGGTFVALQVAGVSVIESSNSILQAALLAQWVDFQCSTTTTGLIRLRQFATNLQYQPFGPLPQTLTWQNF